VLFSIKKSFIGQQSKICIFCGNNGLDVYCCRSNKPDPSAGASNALHPTADETGEAGCRLPLLPERGALHGQKALPGAADARSGSVGQDHNQRESN
jgi:hypothetical protein